MCVSVLSHVWLFATRLDFVACQAPPSMGFSRQEYRSGLSWPPPGDLPESGIEPASAALAGGFFTTTPPGKPRLVDFYFGFWVIVQYYFILLLKLFQLWLLGALLLDSWVPSTCTHCVCVCVLCISCPVLESSSSPSDSGFFKNWRMVLDIKNGMHPFIFNLSWVPVCKMGFLQIAYS